MAKGGAGSFVLVSDWSVEGTLEEVNAVLSAPEEMPRWWPEVYLAVDVLEPGDAEGLGRVVAVHSRGWLPYTLRWTGRVKAVDPPHGWTIESTGDLAGRGVWRMEEADGRVAINYDWQVEVEAPVLRRLAPLLRPAYAANHRWAMARGEAGLRRELARRRATGAHTASGRSPPSPSR